MTYEEAKRRWEAAREMLDRERRSDNWLPSTIKAKEDVCFYWYEIMKKLEKTSDDGDKDLRFYTDDLVGHRIWMTRQQIIDLHSGGMMDRPDFDPSKDVYEQYLALSEYCDHMSRRYGSGELVDRIQELLLQLEAEKNKVFRLEEEIKDMNTWVFEIFIKGNERRMGWTRDDG